MWELWIDLGDLGETVLCCWREQCEKCVGEITGFDYGREILVLCVFVFVCVCVFLRSRGHKLFPWLPS